MKRITRKLTERVKAKIKADHKKLRLKDFDGDALRYLKRVRAAEKTRKKKSDSVARVEDLIIPKDSELYNIISKMAKIKKVTLKQFMKKHKKDIANLQKEGDVILQRETDYLIEDIRKMKKGKKLFVNDGNGYRKTGRARDILNIQVFTQFVMSNSDIFMLTYRVHYKLDGDLTHYLPDAIEYEEFKDNEEGLIAMLDDFYPEITYLKSAKSKEREKEKPKIIAPYSKKRKRKTNAKQSNKRKVTRKTSKGK
jgi:hypothetical protein